VVAAARDIDSIHRGPVINVFFNFGGGCYQTSASTPRGAAIDITSSSTSVKVAAGNTGSTPQGPAIDVFLNFSDGCCRTSVVATAGHSGSTPGGQPSMFGETWYLPPVFSSDNYQGATAVNTTTTSKTSFMEKYFRVHAVPRT
jgi:hypothetical protein